jgi:hypothetical protein
MKKIIFLAVLAITLIFTGCNDIFDQKNLYEKDLSSYYRNHTEVNEALIGAYSCLSLDDGSNHPILMANLKSDDCFSGGGTNDISVNAMDQFINPIEDIFLPIYNRCYQGIFRINTLLANIDKATYDSDSLKNNDLGQAYFLRAFFYFRLAQIFGQVPLDLKPELEYLPKAESAAIYAQISSDMKLAIEKLPNINFAAMDPLENGRATKWAAEALMARIYLFYTGYYKQTSLPLVDGGSIGETDVKNWLTDCIDHSGHDLVTTFKSIWPFSILDSTEYEFAGDVKWAGDGCIETVFAVKYSNLGNWAGAGNNGRLAYCNMYTLYTSCRGKEYPPFGQGWGIGSVNPELYNCYEPNDSRKRSTVIDQALDIKGYTWNADNNNFETGLINKKYSAIVRKNDKGDYQGMYYILYGGQNASNQLWNMQDDIIVRFADVLLMAAELGINSQANLEKVRNRAYYPEKAPALEYSLPNLKLERRRELALEGLRYFDLLRWGDAQTAITSASGTVDVKTAGVPTKYSVNFNEARVFSPLPESQIRVSQGQLIQNPGWTN